MSSPAVYLDYNATTPVADPVYEAMLPFLREEYGNPSSDHRLGRSAHDAVEEARAAVADLLHAQPEEIVFTSGGTESNNLALLGVLLEGATSGEWGPAQLIISAVEHPAITEPVAWLAEQGVSVLTLPVDHHGVVSSADLADALTPHTRLVSIMHANNEIGTLQPIRQFGDACREQGVLIHTDAAQSVGKIPVDVDDLRVDLLSIAGHKLYAPKGVGALYVRRDTQIAPLLRGAGQERGVRPGTENVPYIVGLGAAAKLAAQRLERAPQRLAMLRDRLRSRLEEGVDRTLTVHGDGAERLPNTLSISFPGVVGQELLKEAKWVYASTGAACHAGETRASATLVAIGADDETARGTVRLSVGWTTSEEDVDRAAQQLCAAWRTLVRQS